MADKHSNYRLTPQDKKLIEATFKQVKKLDGEMDAVKEDIKGAWGSLKESGINVKAAKAVYAEQKRRDRMGNDKYEEEEQARDLYRVALGYI